MPEEFDWQRYRAEQQMIQRQLELEKKVDDLENEKRSWDWFWIIAFLCLLGYGAYRLLFHFFPMWFS